jgi:Flp pilus assembly protein TadD
LALPAQLDRRHEAVRDYRESLRLNPNNGTTYYNLANSLEELGRKDEAAEAMRTAADLGDVDALEALGSAAAA